MPASPTSSSRTGAQRGKGEDLAVALPAVNAGAVGQSTDGRVLVLPPPPIQGIGNAAGFTMQVELRDGSFDLAKLQGSANAMVDDGRDAVGLQRVSTSFRANVPQYKVEVDRDKVQTLRLTTDQVFSDARRLSRLDLCQPVQQVRPRLPGLCAGRLAVPPDAGGRSQSLTVRNAERRHDPARHAC